MWRAPEGPEGTGGLRDAAPNGVRSPSLAGGRGLSRMRCAPHLWRTRSRHRHLLPKFRMQFNWVNVQQSLKTLQFQ